jgi:hypothetical protein
VEKTLLGVFLLFAGGMALGNVPQLPDWIKGKVPPVEKNALGGSFMSVDPVLTDANTGASFNRYLYALNSPYKYIDPDGRAVETPWDAANVAMGVVSLTKNLAIGNYAGAVVDVVGVVVDSAATVAPGIPGGAATAINAVRATENIVSAVAKVEGAAVKAESTVVRTTQSGDKAIRTTDAAGSVKDISPKRVKEYVPNTHPKAPEGAMSKVKFENAQPGSKGFKRDPTSEELKQLKEATE